MHELTNLSRYKNTKVRKLEKSITEIFVSAAKCLAVTL